MDFLTNDISSGSSRSGAITAAGSYLNSFAPCLSGDGACNTKLFGEASAQQWSDEIKSSGGKLTYCHPDTNWLKGYSSEGIDPDCILEFNAIITAKGEDRDRDILHPEGANIDPRCPFLLHHSMTLPCGKLIEVLSQDENAVVGKFALVDTELGRDAAKMIKFGCLRISHGFVPVEGKVKPIKVNGQTVGHEIFEFNTFEVSGVSIPAHPSAVVLETFEKSYSTELDGLRQAYDEGFESNMLKSFAKSWYDVRPVIVPGVDLEEKSAEACDCGGTCCETKDHHEEAAYECDHENCDKEGCDCDCHVENPSTEEKSVTEIRAKLSDLQGKSMTGSWEEIEGHLHSIARDYLNEHNEAGLETEAEVHLLGTFEDYAVICTVAGDELHCYKINWVLSGNEPIFVGKPLEVVDVPEAQKIIGANDAEEKEEQEVIEVARQIGRDALFGDEKALAALEEIKFFAKAVEAQKNIVLLSELA